MTKRSDSKCETARHIDMPQHCLFDKHERCELCGGCYTCLREQMPVTVLEPRIMEEPQS